MEKFEELSFEESQKIDGGRINPKAIWNGIKYVYEALQIQDAINDFVDGWNSGKCSCK
jgi:hypothetical protein